MSSGPSARPPLPRRTRRCSMWRASPRRPEDPSPSPTGSGRPTSPRMAPAHRPPAPRNLPATRCPCCCSTEARAAGRRSGVWPPDSARTVARWRRTCPDSALPRPEFPTTRSAPTRRWRSSSWTRCEWDGSTWWDSRWAGAWRWRCTAPVQTGWRRSPCCLRRASRSTNSWETTT